MRPAEVAEHAGKKGGRDEEGADPDRRIEGGGARRSPARVLHGLRKVGQITAGGTTGGAWHPEGRMRPLPLALGAALAVLGASAGCRGPRASSEAHDASTPLAVAAVDAATRFRSTEELVQEPELRARVDALAREHRVDSEGIGEDGAKSRIYALYQRAAEKASASDTRALLAHASPVVRLYFAEHLLATQPDALERLYPLLADGTPIVTQNGCIGAESLVGVEVVHALEWKPVEGGTAFLVRAAQDATVLPETRAAALRAVVQDGDEQAREIALAWLDEKPPLDEAGLGALAKVGLPKDAPRVIPLTRSTNKDTRAAAATALGTAWGPASAEALASLLGDTDSWVRRAAAKSYAMQPVLDATRLGPLLHDDDRMVRDEAIAGLAFRGGEDGLALLLPLLLASDPPNEALDDLFRAPRPSLTVAARKLLEAKDERVRIAAIAYLGKVKDHASAPRLERALGPKAGPLERMEAADAVVLLEDRAAIPALTAMLEDDNGNTRLAGAKALVALHAKEAEPALRRAAAKDTSFAKRGLEEALAALK